MANEMIFSEFELRRSFVAWLMTAPLLSDGSLLSAEAIAALVEVPPDAALGEFAFPCFRLSKALRQAPPALAQSLAEQLKSTSQKPFWIRDVKAVGPYVNVSADFAAWGADFLHSLSSSDRRFFLSTRSETLPRTMIEFSQPNTHKGFHVGHCRNVALGDALVRMNRFLGYDVVAANYIGDDGAHIAKCLWYYTRFQKEPAPATNRGEWLGHIYTAATQKLEDASEIEKVEFQKQISEIQQKLEGQEPELTALWKETRQWSLDAFKEIYDWLGVHFDHDFFESEVLKESRDIVEQGLKQGVFHRSEGAIGVDLEADGLPFLMVLKSDGTTLYATKDLALASRKFDQFKIERSIYVVASEQEMHFKQVFKTLEKLGFSQVKNCFHLSYGLVVLPDGKMSSRVGNVIYFSELRRRLIETIERDVFPQIDTATWTPEEKAETAKRVALAAIKYGMIASDPKKNIVFDMPKWLSFQGDTGPYLLYSYVRMRSILRKAGYRHGELPAEVNGAVFSEDASVKAILRSLMSFNSTVQRAVRDHSPAVLAGYLFDLCQLFNSFYSQTSILKQDQRATQNAYLLLLDGLSKTLGEGCQLLGLEMVERM